MGVNVPIAFPPNPRNTLVNGGSGGGKSVFIKLLILSLKQTGARITLIDFKGSSRSSAYAGCVPDMYGFDNALEGLEAYYERFLEAKERPLPKDSNPKEFLIIEEFLGLRAYYKKDRDKNAWLEKIFTELLVQSRELGMFTIISVQRPLIEYLGATRTSFHTYVHMGEITAEDYRMMFGEKKIFGFKEEKPVLGAGQGLFYFDGASDVKAFCTPYVEDVHALDVLLRER